MSRSLCVHTCCVAESRLVISNWCVLGPLKFPSHSGQFSLNLFPWKLKRNARHHGFSTDTHRHTNSHKLAHTNRLKGNTGACGSLQSRTQGIKKKDRSWIYKYGGKIRGSENQSLSGSLIRTLPMFYNRTMMDSNQLQHFRTGEGNVYLSRYDKGF